MTDRTVESIQQEIKALIKQREDREADLDMHVYKKCRCPKDSNYRCQGHQRAAKGVIASLRKQIFNLRQLETKAITKRLAKRYPAKE